MNEMNRAHFERVSRSTHVHDLDPTHDADADARHDASVSTEASKRSVRPSVSRVATSRAIAPSLHQSANRRPGAVGTDISMVCVRPCMVFFNQSTMDATRREPPRSIDRPMACVSVRDSSLCARVRASTDDDARSIDRSIDRASERARRDLVECPSYRRSVVVVARDGDV